MLVAAADACSAVAARRSPRNARTLHQADGRAGNDRRRLPRRRAGLLPSRPAANCACIASAKDTTDASAAKICHDIAQAFEKQLTYPGEIKVTVLRETRVTEMAGEGRYRQAAN